MARRKIHRPDTTGSGREPAETERTRERQREDEEFVPVIIKRSDEAIRHPDDTLEDAIVEGLEQVRRRGLSLALSALAAGLIIGFTALPVSILASFLDPTREPLPYRLATAAVYPFGFVLCIMSRTQLFTENTATALYPALDRRSGVYPVLRLWVIVIAGNLVGAWLSARLLFSADTIVQARAGYLLAARHLVEPGAKPLFISAVLAGWLMALGGWLVLSTSAGISQILCLYLVTFLIGLARLHHSIAGAVEIFAACLFGDGYSYVQAFRFIGIALAGNLAGGSIFVALLNYGHIRKTQEAR